MPSGRRRTLPEPGERLGQYKLVRLIAKGGMGAVYHALHARTEKPYAVKLLLREVVDDEGSAAFERFRREVDALQRIDTHPSVVAVHGWGDWRGLPWYAMEHVEGHALADWLAEGPMRPDRAARLVAEVARALSHVHRFGLVHRDLKPDNILIDANGTPRVTDFGLAYDAGKDRLTKTGEAVGTPVYMAPEQVDPDNRDGIGAHTDVYGLGALLYAALTAEPPFPDGKVERLLTDIMLSDPPAPSTKNPNVPEPLDVICLCALEKRPEDRFAGAAAMAEDLDRYLQGKQIETRTAGPLFRVWRRLRPRRAASGAVALLIAAAVAAMSAAIVLLAVGGRDPEAAPRARVAALEKAINRPGGLTAAEAAELFYELERAPEIVDDGMLYRRYRVLRSLAKAIGLGPDERPDGVANHLARVLVEDLDDRVRLGFACDVLVANDRLDVLSRTLIASRAIEVVEPRILAAILAAPPSADVVMPDHPDLLQALIGRDDLDHTTKGHLKVHLGHARARGDDPRRAINDYIDAFAVHDVAVDPRDWDVDLREEARAALGRLIDNPTSEKTWAIDVLLSRVGDVRDPIDSELEATLRRLATSPPDTVGASKSEIERLLARNLVAISFLERHSLAGISETRDRVIRVALGRSTLRDAGRREADRPVALRHASALAVLARLLASTKEREGPQWEDDRASAIAFIDAASAAGAAIRLPGFWHQLAFAAKRAGDGERVVRSLREALRVENEVDVSAAQRFPQVPLELAKRLLDDELRVEDPAGDPAVLAEAGQLLLDSVDRQRAVLRAHGDGAEELGLDKRESLAQAVFRYVERLCLRRPALCDHFADAPTADEIIDAAFALDGEKGAEDERRDARVYLFRTRALHHRVHRRLDAAFVELEQAVRSVELEEPEDVPPLLRAQATIREEQGRLIEARQIRAEADRLAAQHGGRGR